MKLLKHVSYGHTLKQYEKRYRNHFGTLLKFTEEEVRKFDKTYSVFDFEGRRYRLDNQNYLLKNRYWWYIEGTYYEVPKAPRWAWFINLAVGWQIATCALLGGAVATGVAVPTILHLSGGGNTPSPKPGPEPGPQPEPEPTKTDVTITFDAGEGEFDEETNNTKSVEVKKGTLWKEVTKPSVKHYDKDFKNFTINDQTIDDNYAFNKDETVKATYSDRYFTVTLNAGDGSFESGKTFVINNVKNHTKWSEVIGKPDKDPEYTDHVFKYWKLGEDKITDGYEIKGNVEFNAYYNETFKVTFNAVDGYWDSETTIHSKDVTVEKDSTWETVSGLIADPTPASNTDTFKFWSTDGTSATQLTNTYKFESATTITACYTKHTDDPFEVASWSEVVEKADEGLNSLLTAYRTNNDFPKTFVGCERTITLTDAATNTAKDYKVRVIDEQADSLQENPNEYGTLTFEFEDVINFQDDFSFNAETTQTNKNKWNGSDLEQSLYNGDIFNAINTPLESSNGELLTSRMKEVSKTTHSSGQTKTPCKLFIPSLTELGIENVDSSVVEDEGYTYNYYLKNNVTAKKKDKTNHPYWLRSDVITDKNNEKVWAIDANGKPSMQQYNSALGVSPCFCLGKSDNKVSVTYSLGEIGEGETIKFSDGTTADKTYPDLVKNTSYSTFKKDELDGKVPTCTKEKAGEKWVFRYWQLKDVPGVPEITEDYNLKFHNTILVPFFEKVETQVRESICIEATTADPVTVSFVSTGDANPGLSYITSDGIDNNEEYTPVVWNTTTVTLDNNSSDDTNKRKLYISSTDTKGEDEGYYNSTISSNDENFVQIKINQVNNKGAATLSGDLRTLLDYKKATTIETCPDYCFYNLFGGSQDYPHDATITLTDPITGLTNANNLTFDFKKIGNSSFSNLFTACKNLIEGPKTFTPIEVGDYSYCRLFRGCLNLNYIPILADVKSTGVSTYDCMFIHCEALKQGPDIMASKIGHNGLASMFKHCKTLERAPNLSDEMVLEPTYKDGEGKTVKAKQHLNGMFIGCSLLVYAPKKLSADVLYERSYHEIFNNCPLLEYGPEICARTTSTGKTEEEATSAGHTALESLFENCTKLQYVKVHNTIWDYSKVTRKDQQGHVTYDDQSDHLNWLKNVKSTGIFECPNALVEATTERIVSTIPSGWTIKPF